MLFEQSISETSHASIEGVTSRLDNIGPAELSEPSFQDDSYVSLKRQSQRLERLLQVMPAGVIVIDGKGVVRQANKLARELLGEPLEAQVWRDIITRSFSPRADDGHEVSLRDGRRVKLSITPLIDEPGQLIVITDLTETRQLQARVSHMQRLSSLGKMVASLAHQIRTPLSAAILYASNLTQAGVADDKRRKFSDRLLDRLHELEAQVNDMLLFAKSGDQQIVTEIDVSGLIEQVKQACSSLLQNAQVTLTVDITDEARDCSFLANETALKGALANLIDNAVQASPKGANVELCCDVDKEENQLKIAIRDEGCGLPNSALSQLFEPFYTTKTNGTGLGLAVVQQAVRAHKGHIYACNRPTGGAAFMLSLPLEESKPSTQSNVVMENANA